MTIGRIALWAACTVSLVLAAVGQPAASQAERPFRLPMAAPPGPSTWLLGQTYGNTVGAYLRGREWYEAGQRLHFGLDFSMPCGTPLVAIGDGQVAFVDDLGFGSGPHNLLIRHDTEGYVSLYGHLLERPALTPGQLVRAGDVVGRSGDPDVTCDSRPHLHLEIRSLNYQTTYNPVALIDANWDMLASIGPFSFPLFMQDLDNARRWMTMLDQPEVVFGGGPLNDYAASFPDLRDGAPSPAPPLPRSIDPLSADAEWSASPLTFAGCCASLWWDAQTPDWLYTIDGTEAQRAGIFLWDTNTRSLLNIAGTAPPPIRSADGTHEIMREGAGVRIRRTADSAEWVVDTGGQYAMLSADNSRLLWTVTPPSASLDAEPVTQVWASAADGSFAAAITEATQASAQWLDTTRVLVASRSLVTTTLIVVDTASGEVVTLGSWDRLRGLSVAPGGGRVLFSLVFQADPASSGLYVLDTQTGARPVRLPWFGASRWRDDSTLFYLPFQPNSPYHTLHYVDLRTGEDRPILSAEVAPFTVSGGRWSVSADGGQIAFWNARDETIWLLEPPR